jgi:tetratricopeptide (TPR) repeat protein
VPVIDDVARADEATRQVLAAILRNPPPSILVILAARTDELADSPMRAILRETPTLRRLKLQPLGAVDVEALLDSVLALGQQPRRMLAARLHADSGGNPFYITELVAALADGGLLALDSNGTWQVATGIATRPLPLPSEIRDTIRSRVERLGAPTRQALYAAAVLGTAFDATLLEAIAGLAPDELAGALDDLVSRRLLRPSSDIGGYEFTREMIWRAAYDNVPAATRKALHVAALAALDRASSDDPSMPRLRDYHRERAGAIVVQTHDLRRARRRQAAAIAALLLAVAAGLAFWKPGSPAAGAVADRRVVVGSFTNETGDPALDLIGPIAADWLVQGIAKTGVIQVIPLTFAGSANPIDGSGAPGLGRLRDLARDAQADVLIRGAYHASGDSIHIRAQIIDVRRGELLQAVAPVGAPVSTPMVAVEALRERTLGSLVPWVDPRMAASARMQGSPPSYESYLLFAQGLEHSYRRDMQSIDFFLRAYALDTSYAAPLLHVTSEYRSTGQYAAADSTIRRILPRRAELTPFERHILDWHRAWLGGDLSRQYAAVAAAAEIAPGSRMAALHLPGLAVSLNLPRRAVELFSRVDRDGAEAQSSSYWVWFAGAHHMAGEFDSQLEIGRLVQRRFPQDPRGLSHQARALAALGRLNELDAVLAQSLALPVPDGWEPTGLWIHLVAADELADHGHPAAARRVIERALRFYDDVPAEIRERLRYQFALGQALFRAERLDEARDVFEELMMRDSLHNEYRVAIRAHVGWVAARQGDLRTAREIDNWLRDPGLPYLFGQNTEARGVLAGLLGDRDMAVRLLRQATGEGRPYDSSTRGRHEFAPLRGYPPFEDWVRPRG